MVALAQVLCCCLALGQAAGPPPGGPGVTPRAGAEIDRRGPAVTHTADHTPPGGVADQAADEIVRRGPSVTATGPQAIQTLSADEQVVRQILAPRNDSPADDRWWIVLLYDNSEASHMLRSHWRTSPLLLA